MEPLKAISKQAQPLQDNENSSSLSLGRQSLIIRLDTLMLFVLSFWPVQDRSDETITEYRAAFREMMQRHGPERVEEAMKELRLKSKFLPHPAEVNELITETIQREESAARWKRQEEHQAQKREEDRLERARVEASGGYCSMADVLKDFYGRKAAKAAEKD